MLVEDLSIILIERVQKRATKYILCYTITYSGYKLRLVLMRLKLLPLMYIYNLADVMFFIKSIKFLSEKFNIFNHVEFTFGPARSDSAGLKLRHKPASTK